MRSTSNPVQRHGGPTAAHPRNVDRLARRGLLLALGLLAALTGGLLFMPSPAFAYSVSITSGPANPTNQTSATFTMQASETSLGWKCWLDDVQFVCGGGGVSHSVTLTNLAEGTHTLRVYNHSDEDGGDASATYTWVVDTTAPTVSVPGRLSVGATSTAGVAVSFTVTASDSLPVSCTAFGATNGTVQSGSIFQLGTTTVTCTARDAAGNTGSAFFNVEVRLLDTTPPTIVGMPANMTIEATRAGGVTANWNAPSVFDNADRPGTATCSPASGSAFPLGTTTVTCTAKDTAGNTTQATFTVTVVDRTAPILVAPANQTAEATGPNGAPATWTAATATDLVDAAPTVTCSPASGSTFKLGATTVTCTATDKSGNAATGKFTVTVRDTTAPKLTVPADRTALTAAAGGTAVTYTTTATDVVSGAVTPSCDRASGATFPVGTTTVKCTATDGAGNVATGSFKVTVTQATLLPPLDKGKDHNAGSTIPVKFRLSSGTSAVTNATGTVSVAGQTVAFAWDAAEQLYKAEVKTDKARTGQFPVTLEVTGIGSATLTTVTLK